MLSYNDLLNVPFVDSGREIKTGLDCYGLFLIVQKRLGNELPDYNISCSDVNSIYHKFIAVLSKWQKVENPDLGDGVALAINLHYPNIIQHFGVCVNKRQFIHTTKKTGVIVSRIDDMCWSNYIKGYYRWKK